MNTSAILLNLNDHTNSIKTKAENGKPEKKSLTLQHYE